MEFKPSYSSKRRLSCCFPIRSISIVALYLALTFTPGSVLSQDILEEVTGPTSPLIHTPPPAAELPEPGKPMLLSVHIKGVKDLEMRAQALLVRDGKLMPLSSSRAYLDEHDRATFDFNLFSPLAEISYYFVVFPKNNLPQSSKRYVVKRSCIPRVKITQLTPPQPDQEAGVKEKMELLLLQAKGLERDLLNYENILTLIKQIKEGVPQ